jgi:AbrB family looped-hinge helix DNA binding protein
MKYLNDTLRVRFSSRGRVTIPAALRRKYGIKGGSRVAFEVRPHGFLLKSVEAKKR